MFWKEKWGGKSTLTVVERVKLRVKTSKNGKRVEQRGDEEKVSEIVTEEMRWAINKLKKKRASRKDEIKKKSWIYATDNLQN